MDDPGARLDGNRPQAPSRRERMISVSSRTRPSRLLAYAATVAVLVTACGTPQGVSAPGGTGTGPDPTAGARAHLAGYVQSDPWSHPVTIDAGLRIGPDRYCGGLAHTDNGFTLLTDADEVVGVVVCGVAPGELPGDGIWAVVTEHRVPEAQLPALVDALRQPNYTELQASVDFCEHYGVIVPMFTITTASGELLQGAVPSDGCHPLESAVRILTGAMLHQPAVDSWRTRQLSDEASVTTDCTQRADTLTESSPAPGEPVVEELTYRLAELKGSHSSPEGASVCLYGPSGPVAISAMEAPGDVSDLLPNTRRGAGFIDAGLRDQLMNTIAPTAPAGSSDCALSQPWPPGADGATYLRLSGVSVADGEREVGIPFLYVEVGPCGRVIDGQYQPVGWADSAVVTEIRSRLG